MRDFLLGVAFGGTAVFIVYHFALQPYLQKLRDKAIAEAKQRTGLGNP